MRRVGLSTDDPRYLKSARRQTLDRRILSGKINAGLPKVSKFSTHNNEVKVRPNG